MSENRTPHLVIGTAGHIDHGKTALVKALTGTDTDRLAEEQRRGITIELGFAFYSDRAAFVDVPGHERLVKNMIAGASAMRAALFVVAADDGVMPQTREHLAVLDALGVVQGVVAVTKADLADDEWIELVVEDVRELLELTGLAGSPIVVADSISGRGLDELRSELDRMIEETVEPGDPGFFRMPIDRSFLIKGHGRVATGTVWSGSAAQDDRLSLLPGGVTMRVRGLQAHEQPVELVRMGDRAALNLTGDTVPRRGDQLVTPGRGVVSEFLDIKVSLLPDARRLRHRTRVRLHFGTGEVIGRLIIVGAEFIEPGSSGLSRVALEGPLASMLGDRGVIRLYSPLETLGGVIVLDPSPPDRRRTLKGLEARLEDLAAGGDRCVRALVASRRLIKLENLVGILPWSKSMVAETAAGLAEEGHVRPVEGQDRWYIESDVWNGWRNRSREVLTKFHRDHPDEPGMHRDAWAKLVIGQEVPEEVLAALIGELGEADEAVFDGGILRDGEHTARLQPEDEETGELIMRELRQAGLNVPLPSRLAESIGESEDEVRRLLRALKQVRQVVILDEKVVVEAGVIEEVKSSLKEKFGYDRTFTVGEAAEALSSSRKYLIPLLGLLDGSGFTLREGDKRRIAR